MADHTPSASPARAEGQDGAPSAWAQGEAQRLLDEAGYGYPTQEPRTYVRAIVARALDAARAEERGELRREGWLRHAAGCSAAFGDTYRCRCGLAAALRARGEEAQ